MKQAVFRARQALYDYLAGWGRRDQLSMRKRVTSFGKLVQASANRARIANGSVAATYGPVADNRAEAEEEAVTNLVDLEAVEPFDVWGEAVRARKIEGERLTLAVVELGPDALVPEHRHESEQIGICIEGSITFTVDGETRELGPGGSWRILSNRPHVARAGPRGAIVIDAFAPIRSDWQFPLLAPQRPTWPRPEGTEGPERDHPATEPIL